MVIVNQHKTGTTESLEFEIREVKTCKNTIVKEEQWEKFKKITQKENNYISIRELKGLGELLGKDMTKSVYAIVEIEKNRNFGIYSTKEKAKKVLQTIIRKIERQKSYTLPEDNFTGITIL